METRSSFKLRPGSEKPREKLKLYGSSFLSEAELLAIILRTGSNKSSVLELSERLLNTFGGLKGLLEATLEELEGIEGMGLAKACQIKAVAEIVKRIERSPFSPYIKILNPFEAYRFLKGVFSWEREEIYVLSLDAKGKLLGVKKVGQGTLAESPFYPREVISAVIKSNASRMIISHNHLSGDPSPSEEDILVTEKIKELAFKMDIRFDDHIIIGNKRFYSFAKKAVLEEG
ncbi:MAG: DNA repair protein RadC [Synergistetes bacterium]|nr:DNA repair protein RadC [Synergistota bacterium]MCX8127146.1 DNA repair protein RadC [Synergistota bacterium]MDW8191968.1 DNA repair protein RadC [Synergistota bacterium]